LPSSGGVPNGSLQKGGGGKICGRVVRLKVRPGKGEIQIQFIVRIFRKGRGRRGIKNIFWEKESQEKTLKEKKKVTPSRRKGRTKERKSQSLYAQFPKRICKSGNSKGKKVLGRTKKSLGFCCEGDEGGGGRE